MTTQRKNICNLCRQVNFSNIEKTRRNQEKTNILREKMSKEQVAHKENIPSNLQKTGQLHNKKNTN